MILMIYSQYVQTYMYKEHGEILLISVFLVKLQCAYKKWI